MPLARVLHYGLDDDTEQSRWRHTNDVTLLCTGDGGRISYSFTYTSLARVPRHGPNKCNDQSQWRHTNDVYLFCAGVGGQIPDPVPDVPLARVLHHGSVYDSERRVHRVRLAPVQNCPLPARCSVHHDHPLHRPLQAPHPQERCLCLQMHNRHVAILTNIIQIGASTYKCNASSCLYSQTKYQPVPMPKNAMQTRAYIYKYNTNRCACSQMRHKLVPILTNIIPTSACTQKMQ